MSLEPSTPRVFHLVYSLIRGGTEGQCARVAMMFARAGHVHRVGVSRREGYFLAAVEEACGPVYHMDIRRSFGFHTWREVRRLASYLRKERIDLLHAWDADAAIFGSRAARLAGIPYLTSRRDLGQIYAPRKLRRMRDADAGARGIVVNAAVIGQRLDSTDKVNVIGNIIDLAEFDALAARPFSQSARLPAGRLVGMVSRLDPEKDGELFVKAAGEICRRSPDVHFVVAGDGPCRAAMEELSARLGVSERVIFLGDIKDVPSLLRRLSIGVLVPRSNEGLSNSILEYMAAALPVVATDCGGNAELVKAGETGAVIPAGDLRILAEEIGALLADPGKAAKWGRAGRTAVEQGHAPEVVFLQFAELYRQMIP